MKKSEIFALAAGTIGLIVDLIALSSFLGITRSGNANDPHEGWQVWLVFLLVYGWFLVAWFLTRQYRRRRGSQRKIRSYRDFEAAIQISVISTGILILPIAIKIIYHLTWDWEGDPIEKVGGIILLSIVALGLTGAAIYFAIGGLMPIIYEDEKLN